MVVGSEWDDTGAGHSGVVHIYDLGGPTPTFPAMTLTNPTPSDDVFGSSVAISGTRAVIGAPQDKTGAIAAGSVYVYNLASDTPTLPMLTLTNPTPAVWDAFGWSVAISGTRVVVGAVADDIGATDAGSAYVFDLASAGPTVPTVTLTNPSPAANDRFGNSVAVSGARVVVGAFLDDTGAADAGSAYVFDLNSPTPRIPVATLNNPAPQPSAQHGWSVACSGSLVAVGARADSTGAAFAGIARVYDFASATPTVPIITLTNPSPTASGNFGYSLSMSGQRLAVGTFSGATHAGCAYLFDLSRTNPTVPAVTINNPSPGYGDGFGNSVALDGSTLVVGCLLDDTTGQDNGAAYVYTPSLPPTICIEPAGAGAAAIWWTPTNSPGFILQFSDSGPNNWVNAPSGAAHPITVPTTNTARFYRLIKL